MNVPARPFAQHHGGSPSALPVVLVLTLGMATGACAQITLVEPGFFLKEVGALPAFSDAIGAVAEDSAGNLYVVGKSGWIHRRSPGGAFNAWLEVPGATNLYGLVIDGTTLYAGSSAGDVYQADWSAPSPAPFKLGTAVGTPASGLTISCLSRNLLLGSDDGVESMDVVTGVSTLLAVAGGKASALACDPLGTSIVYADQQDNLVVRVDALGISTTLQPVGRPDGIATHPVTGDIYVTSASNNEILRIDPTGATLSTFVSGLDLNTGAEPTPLAFSPDGAVLYFATRVAGRMRLYQVDGFGSKEISVEITSPASGGTGNGDVAITFDATDTGMDPVTVTMEYSVDDGQSWAAGTMAAASVLSNPTQPLGSPALSATMIWNSFADGIGLSLAQPGVILRLTSSDGVNQARSYTTFDVDNLTAVSWTSPAGGSVQTGDADLTFDGHDADSDPLPATFEFSLDAGLTWTPCTVAATSPLSNPSAPLPTPIIAARVVWDSLNDGIGLVAPTPATVRITATDGGRVSHSLMPMVVDNSSMCTGSCGDCDINSIGPDILDSLEAAKIGAGMVSPTLGQQGCCDVNSSGAVDVLDALRLAQSAAGLPVNFGCP